MNANLASRAAAYLTWLRFLTDVRLLVTVGVDAIVLCHVFPAFRRTSNRAFLFIAIACVLGIIETVYDQTINYRGLSNDTVVIIATLRHLSSLADAIFWCAGTVLLVRPYLHQPAVAEVGGSTGAQSCAPSNGGPAEPMGRPKAGQEPPSVS